MDKRHLLSLKSRMAGVMVKPAAKKRLASGFIYRYPIDAMLLHRNMGDVSVLELGILNHLKSINCGLDMVST
jgi:hypothetical protein